MTIIDLNGKLVKVVNETPDLVKQANLLLEKMIDDSQECMNILLASYKEFPEFQNVISVPIREFVSKTEEMRTIVQKGKLKTHALGIELEEDYAEMRQDLLKEAMYYIEKNSQ